MVVNAADQKLVHALYMAAKRAGVNAKLLGVADTMMRGPMSAANDLAVVKLASIRIWLRAY